MSLGAAGWLGTESDATNAGWTIRFNDPALKANWWRLCGRFCYEVVYILVSLFTFGNALCETWLGC
jgi:hypothetical protein